MIIEFLGLSILEWVVVGFLIAGLFFEAIAAFGVMRLPDFYSRLHASGMGETLGLLLTFVGLAIYEIFVRNGGILAGGSVSVVLAIKLIICFLIVFLANPIGTHILCKSAYESGVKHWTLADKKKEEDHHAESPH